MDSRVLMTPSGTLKIVGALNFDTVMLTLAQALPCIPQEGELVIDLSDLTQCDSSSLALLMELLREAKKRNSKLHFSQVPPFLCDIARVSGLDMVLPVVS